MKQVKTATIAATVLCDYKLRRIQALWEEINVVCDCCYIILLFGVLFLFVLESKECSLAVRRTTAAQTHAT